jgi:5'-nucleotidase
MRSCAKVFSQLPTNSPFLTTICSARRHVDELRAREKVDLVVAVTHMRLSNDQRLAQALEGKIDLILGGHDHAYVTDTSHGVPVVKSGSDFRDVTEITVTFNDVPKSGSGFDGRVPVTIETKRHQITNDIEPDPIIEAAVKEHAQGMDVHMARVIGDTSVDLDCRFKSIRTKETNIGNFVTDAIRHGCKCEVVGWNFHILYNLVFHIFLEALVVRIF